MTLTIVKDESFLKSSLSHTHNSSAHKNFGMYMNLRSYEKLTKNLKFNGKSGPVQLYSTSMRIPT